MGANGSIGCTPTLAAPNCTPSLARGSKAEECFDPCTPALAGMGRTLDPLSDQECADIALVQAAVRGELADVVKALSMGASPNTIAELTLRMGEPSKKGRKGRAVHMTPLMRACELGHEDVVQHLLKAGASSLQCDSHGWTPLCHALGSGEVGIARLICQHPNFKKQRQKEICVKLKNEILMKCRIEASAEALAAVGKELEEPGGMLDIVAQDGAERGGFHQEGVSEDKIHPLLVEDSEAKDWLSDSYAYPNAQTFS